MHAYALSALAPILKRTSRVLDIGSGSGYTVAVAHRMLANLPAATDPSNVLRSHGAHPGRLAEGTGTAMDAGEFKDTQQGTVVGVDHIPQLVTQSENNLRADSLGQALDTGQIHMVAVDGREGYPEHAPYDAIHVGAAAAGQGMLKTLLSQLASPGMMWVPVVDGTGDTQAIWLYTKDDQGQISQERMMGVMVRNERGSGTGWKLTRELHSTFLLLERRSSFDSFDVLVSEGCRDGQVSKRSLVYEYILCTIRTDG